MAIMQCGEKLHEKSNNTVTSAQKYALHVGLVLVGLPLRKLDQAEHDQAQTAKVRDRFVRNGLVWLVGAGLGN